MHVLEHVQAVVQGHCTRQGMYCNAAQQPTAVPACASLSLPPLATEARANGCSLSLISALVAPLPPLPPAPGSRVGRQVWLLKAQQLIGGGDDLQPHTTVHAEGGGKREEAGH